jgi:hypothetical protein
MSLALAVRHRVAPAMLANGGAENVQEAVASTGWAGLPLITAASAPPSAQLFTGFMNGPVIEPLHPSVGAGRPFGNAHE